MKTQAELNRILPGRSPFIVPPAAAKSSFYANPVTRQLWRDAATALTNASWNDAVGLLGYSLPSTDLVVSGMLADSLSDRDAPVDIVNLCPEGIEARLIYLGAGTCHRATDGEMAIANYVDWLEYQHAVVVQKRLAALDPEDDLPLLVATSEQQAGVVVGIKSDGSDGQPVELEIEPMGNLLDALRKRYGTEPRPAPRTHDLKPLPPTGFRVQYSDEYETQIVDLARHNDGFSPPQEWQVLVPSAHPYWAPGR